MGAVVGWGAGAWVVTTVAGGWVAAGASVAGSGVGSEVGSVVAGAAEP